jgi:uncharacterized protein (DUF885 family)
MRNLFLIALFSGVLAMITSCELPGADAATQEEVAEASERLQDFLREYDAKLLATNPCLATFSGSRVGWDRLSSGDDSRHFENEGLLVAWMERMDREVDTSQLDPWTLMHYHLFRAYAGQQQQAYRWRLSSFPSDPTEADGINALLTRAHPMETPADAEAFVKRLEALPALLRQWQVRLGQAQRDSLLPTRTVIAQVRHDAVQVAGIMTADSHLVADPAHPWLQRIYTYADAHPELSVEGANLRRRAWEAYSFECIPEYNHLLQWFYQAESTADSFKVVSQLPSGAQYYNYLLSSYAGVPTTGNDAYTLGTHKIDEVEKELRELITQEKFPGGVAKFIDSLRVSHELYLYNPSPAGKVEFSQRVSRMHDSLCSGLKKMADFQPAYQVHFAITEVISKERESPFLWEVISGTSSANLSMNMACRSQLESWRWPAMLAGQGVPGRLLPEAFHSAIRDSFLLFRQQMDAPWFFEGWALYSTSLPFEQGLYRDSVYVRSVLLNQLIHAVILVVDAGLHSNQWTVPQAELFLREKTPLTSDEIRQVVRQVLDHPGASVASVAGCERIRAWRDQAEKAARKNFSASAFHFLLLRKGPLPVPVMEREIRLWLSPSQPEAPES